jgi:glycosyltransferase involved in cell wall biosynthesis
MGSYMGLELVSIIIPAFNHGRYLGQAIDSVLGQDYPNIELIVLDDGSTDNTRAVLESYGDAFHWETHPNMGQANTLNKGWQQAKGSILSYLGADDVLMPDAVSSSLAYLQGDVVLTYGDFNLIDPSSKIIRQVAAPEFNYIEMYTKFICQPGPGVFMTRRAYEVAGGWDSTLKQMPDHDYWLRLGLVGPFVRVPKVLAAFRVHDDSQTYAISDAYKAEEPLRVIHKFIDHHALPPELFALKHVAMSSAWLFTAQLHIRAGRLQKGFAALWRSATMSPGNFFSLRTFRILFNSFLNRGLHRLIRLKNRLGSR